MSRGFQGTILAQEHRMKPAPLFSSVHSNPLSSYSQVYGSGVQAHHLTTKHFYFALISFLT